MGKPKQNSASWQKDSSNFNENDRQKLDRIITSIDDLVDEIRVLKNELFEAKSEVKKVKAQNNRLKQALNTYLYKLDDLDQRSPNFFFNGPDDSINLWSRAGFEQNIGMLRLFGSGLLGFFGFHS